MKPHGHDREICLKHLPVFGRDTYVIIQPPRYQCLECYRKPTTTQQAPWYVRRSIHTIAYEKHVLLQLIGSTVEEVSITEGIGYEAVMGIVRRHVQTEVDWNDIDSLEQLGLDEIALKKGHKDFVTIVSARIGNEIMILAVLITVFIRV